MIRTSLACSELGNKTVIKVKKYLIEKKHIPCFIQNQK